MKKILILLAALLLGTVTIEAGNPLKAPDIYFETTLIETGDLPYEKGISYTFKFPYQNRGEGDLIVSAVVPGCYCVVPEYSTKPLKMGQTDTLTVTFNPYRAGKFRHMLTVCSNTEHQICYVTFRGTLTEK